MYAFNSRFKPTLWKGLPNMTWGSAMLGIILGVFSLGAYTHLQNTGLMIVLDLSAILAFWYAIRAYQRKDEARFMFSRTVGKRDIRTKSMGL